jgi:small-conductance mechanosensitive channel
VFRHSLRLAVSVLAIGLAAPAAAQTAPAGPPSADPFPAAVALGARSARIADEPAPLVYANRAVVQLRATVLSRPPAQRAAAAVERLDQLLEQVPAGRVSTRAYEEAILVLIDDRPVFVLFAADVDALGGEKLEPKAAEAAARLQMAFDEAVELRTPVRLLRGVLLAVGATALYAAALWGLIRLDRRVAARLSSAAERRLLKLPGGEIIVGVAHAPAYVRRALTFGGVLLGLLLTYAWLGAVLRQLPYTRPWGESLRRGLWSFAASTGAAIVDELPNLATVLGIVVVTRFLARLTTLAFRRLEEGRVTVPWIYPETAQPTRRIAVALLWLFALIASYKYLPGSESEVFKGVSVFVGLIVSLGSTGIMNQLMSGLMVTYSRALRVGDFVKIADVEGVVTQLGTLSTKIKTARNEEITIPNAVVVSQAATNYSRHAERDGVFAPTSLTIGYDVPWRQVHALLLLAAERTPSVRTDPKPVVLQVALCDFYVRYTLLVCLEQPQRRVAVLAALHANIQDAFNEYGVQIMSPNYEADPSGPKVVPPSRWYSAPASGPREGGHDRPPVRMAEEEVVGGG